MNVTDQDKAHAALSCVDLVREFPEGGKTLRVLSGASMQVSQGERIAIIGESGAGKTTLLQLLGGLDLPTSGKVFVDGKDIAALNGTERGLIRNRSLGFVYQFHHLLPEFTALENVAMPLLLRKAGLVIRARATAALCRSPPDNSPGR